MTSVGTKSIESYCLRVIGAKQLPFSVATSSSVVGFE